MKDKLLTVEETAERLGTSVRFVRRLVFERRIAYVSSAATSASLTATWTPSSGLAAWRSRSFRP